MVNVLIYLVVCLHSDGDWFKSVNIINPESHFKSSILPRKWRWLGSRNSCRKIREKMSVKIRIQGISWYLTDSATKNCHLSYFNLCRVRDPNIWLKNHRTKHLEDVLKNLIGQDVSGDKQLFVSKHRKHCIYSEYFVPFALKKTLGRFSRHKTHLRMSQMTFLQPSQWQ